MIFMLWVFYCIGGIVMGFLIKGILGVLINRARRRSIIFLVRLVWVGVVRFRFFGLGFRRFLLVLVQRLVLHFIVCFII
jgi:hypothetical protein